MPEAQTAHLGPELGPGSSKPQNSSKEWLLENKEETKWAQNVASATMGVKPPAFPRKPFSHCTKRSCSAHGAAKYGEITPPSPVSAWKTLSTYNLFAETAQPISKG